MRRPLVHPGQKDQVREGVGEGFGKGRSGALPGDLEWGDADVLVPMNYPGRKALSEAAQRYNGSKYSEKRLKKGLGQLAVILSLQRRARVAGQWQTSCWTGGRLLARFEAPEASRRSTWAVIWLTRELRTTRLSFTHAVRHAFDSRLACDSQPQVPVNQMLGRVSPLHSTLGPSA